MAAKTINAWAVKEAGGKATKIEIELPPLADDEVELKIECCGLCHSDLHLALGEWGPLSVWPQVCGHEIVGAVVSKGAAVKGLELGQRAAVGWYRDSCGACDVCLADKHSLCPANVPTCAGGNKGGFADAIRVKATHAFPVPDALASEHAAPLMCGGITVYSPLAQHTAPHHRVGIVGAGGLGAMAIQFARARGNRVVALSTSPDKEALVRELGAHEFINTKDAAQVAAAADSLDFVLVTVSAAMDLAPIIATLKRRGKLCVVGAMPHDVSVSPWTLILKEVVITGSATGGRGRIAEMLRFAADHGIKPMVEQFPMSEEGIAAAFEQLKANKIRFRGVLRHE